MHACSPRQWLQGTQTPTHTDVFFAMADKTIRQSSFALPDRCTRGAPGERGGLVCASSTVHYHGLQSPPTALAAAGDVLAVGDADGNVALMPITRVRGDIQAVQKLAQKHGGSVSSIVARAGNTARAPRASSSPGASGAAQASTNADAAFSGALRSQDDTDLELWSLDEQGCLLFWRGLPQLQTIRRGLSSATVRLQLQNARAPDACHTLLCLLDVTLHRHLRLHDRGVRTQPRSRRRWSGCWPQLWAQM